MKRHLKLNVIRVAICLMLILPTLGFSQADNQPQNVHIASPNSSSLGKVVDIPISYHTGIPNIEIPIYTIHEGPLTLPISLNYHAGGLKVMEQASWVGAGFSLSAGGMITRIVRGLPDEQLTATPAGSDLSSQAVSYLQNHGYYNYYIYNASGTPHAGIDKNPNYQAFGGGQADGEADLFTFNFNGYSGKFYFRGDTTVVTAPLQDLVITPKFCPNGAGWCSQTSQNLSGWTVTTPDGTKYYFGLNASSTSSSGPIESTGTSLSGNWQAAHTVSSWYLYKIQSADSQFSINLSYTNENYSFYSLSMTSHSGSEGSSDNTCYAPVKNVMSGARLYRIDFSNGTVYFNESANPRQDLSDGSIGFWDNDQSASNVTSSKALDNIKITGTNFCQQFYFAYDYFYDPNPLTGNMALATFTANNYHVHTDQKRLKLLSLTEKSCDGTIVKPPHIFTYDETAPPPRTLSLAQDHWGFYNGATGNSGLIPLLSDDGGLTGLPGFNANRNSSWPAMRAGALMKIQYPTGGYTRFVYGSHSNILINQYSQQIPVTVGGLRIDSMIYNNGFDSKQNIRTFSYTNDDGTPSGVLFSKPSYIALLRNDVIHMLDGIYVPGGNDYIISLPGGCFDDDLNNGPTPRNAYFYSTATILPMRTSQGNHFGYNQVRVNELDGSYTIYKFTPYVSPTDAVATTIVNKAQCNLSVPNYPPAPLPFDFGRGDLINKSIYNAAGKILKETRTTSQYTYQTVGVTGVIARLHAATWFGTEYEIFSGKKTKLTEDVFTYDATNPTNPPVHTTTVTNYASPNHSFPTSVVTTDASGGKILADNRNTYIGDITIPVCNVAQSFDTNLRTDLNSLKTAYYTDPGTITASQRYSRWQQYMLDINTKWTNYVANYLSYNSTYKTCMTGTSASWNWNTATPDLKALVILKKRNQINTILENSHWLDGKFLSSSFLNYKDFAGDGVGIYPVKYEAIMPNVPLVSTAFAPVTVNSGGTALVKDSKYAQEATYVYKANQPVEVTGKDGVTTSYIWGFTNNLPLVQAVGVNYATLSAAYTAVSGNLTTLRSQSSLSNAQLTTYSYDPLSGMTTQTDPNGVTITYKYDVIGRLLYITDQNSKILKQYSYKYSNLNNH